MWRLEPRLAERLDAGGLQGRRDQAGAGLPRVLTLPGGPRDRRSPRRSDGPVDGHAILGRTRSTTSTKRWSRRSLRRNRADRRARRDSPCPARGPLMATSVGSAFECWHCSSTVAESARFRNVLWVLEVRDVERRSSPGGTHVGRRRAPLARSPARWLTAARLCRSSRRTPASGTAARFRQRRFASSARRSQSRHHARRLPRQLPDQPRDHESRTAHDNRSRRWPTNSIERKPSVCSASSCIPAATRTANRIAGSR